MSRFVALHGKTTPPISFLNNPRFRRFIQILLVNKLDLVFRNDDVCAKLHRSRSKIVACIVFIRERYISIKNLCFAYIGHKNHCCKLIFY